MLWPSSAFRNVFTSDFYSGGYRFEFGPRHWLNWQK